MSHTLRRLRAVGAALALCAAAVAGFAATPLEAQAAAPVPIPAQNQWTYTASPVPSAGPRAPQTAASAPVIDCTLNVQDPHPSSHVGGTINVVATIGCNVAPANMSLQVTLYKIVCDPGCSQTPYGATGSKTVFLVKNIQANSATVSCTPGDYFGVAYGSISSPGYYPAGGAISGAGRTVPITC